MPLLVISGIIFFLWSCLIIFLYYTTNLSHLTLIGGVPMGGLIGFAIGILVIYGSYKLYLASKDKKLDTTWSFWHIIGGFFVMLFATTALYNSNLASNIAAGNAIPWVQPSLFVLFGHILTLMIVPVFFVFLWRAVGNTLFLKSESWKNYPLRFTLPIETALGMGIFALLLFIAGYVGQYHFTSLLVILAIMTLVGVPGFITTYKNIRNEKIVFENTSAFSLRTISAELAFLAFAFVASTSLLNALRPMPIGWDDLGVYMNFPKIMANIGMLLEGSGMYIWQLITGSGYLFDNTASQAFYINQIGGFLATITIIASLSLLLGNEKEKNTTTYIALPMLLGIVYYLMPMTVFQQAKDMKLDPALMFVSISAVMSLIYGVLENKKGNTRPAQMLLFVAGILTGIAFGIKFTTLMLIIAGMGFISYRFLGIGGFIGFFGAFIAIFTKGNLWAQLFVWMPENNTAIVLIGILMMIGGYGYAIYKHQKKEVFIKYILASLLFGFGIFLAISPWLIKNYDEIQERRITVAGLLNGYSTGKNPEKGVFVADYTKLYSEEEYQNRTANNQATAITGSGQSMNEDFSRYFGQETGLNNYIKLPVNLTIQANQTGEFTDITFIFLAFVPVALLFLRTKGGNRRLIWISGVSFFLLLFFPTATHIFQKLFPTSTGLANISRAYTDIFASIHLPEVYGVVIILVLGFLALALYCLEDNDEENPTRGILFLLGLYGMIFWVSAFGIVWYGVLIYFLMLAIIGLGMKEVNTSRNEDSEVVDAQKKAISIGFFILIGFYIFGSAMMHSYKNLITADYDIYKYKTLSQETSIFLYKSEYFDSLLEMNVQDKNALLAETIADIQNSSVASILTQIDKHNQENLPRLHGFLQSALTGLLNEDAKLAREISPQARVNRAENEVHIQSLQKILDTLYKKILYPTRETRNNTGIYRIGTFMTYFIQNNRSRYYDDSLLSAFQTYFYDKNTDVAIDRMKKLGLGYVLVDLNAATIDKDPRHALTERYENLLLTVRNKQLSIASTDNMCLRMAIDEYHDGKLQNDREFLSIAGTNYVSYVMENGQERAISPSEKQANCMNYMAQNNLGQKYDYLASIPNVETATREQLETAVRALVPARSWFALFKINE